MEAQSQHYSQVDIWKIPPQPPKNCYKTFLNWFLSVLVYFITYQKFTSVGPSEKFFVKIASKMAAETS